MKARVKAWVAHLGISLGVMAPVFVVIFVFWFPAPWFEVQDTGRIVAVLVGVDLVLGPLLTFIVYRPGKKGLKFDLTVIALLQLAALAYGTWSIHSERPSYVVFALDRFVPVARKDVEFAQAGLNGYGEAPLRGPLYVFAEMPVGKAFETFQDSVLFGGRADLEGRPEFWLPFETGREAVLATTRPLAQLRGRRPAHDEELAAAARRLGLDPREAPFLPLAGKTRDFAALLDPVTARVLGVVPMDPWIRRETAP